jgi:peptidoglycan/LPS O-acetylase OafA/YrhL
LRWAWASIYLLVTAAGSAGRKHALIVAAVIVGVLVSPTVPARAVVLAVWALFCLAVRGCLRWIVNPVTVFFGTISYSLYLVHQNIGYIVIRGSVPTSGARRASQWRHASHSRGERPDFYD